MADAGLSLLVSDPSSSGGPSGGGSGEDPIPSLSGGHLTGSNNQKRKRRLADLSQEEINEIVALRGKLPQATVGKRFGIEQTDVSQIQRLQKGKSSRLEDKRRVKDIEVVLPIVYGTISFWLGKKADEFHSHKWTVYVRAANNEDLGDLVKRVVFNLHPSFNNPTRVVEEPPFELSETGWGEFEIGITIWLHADASEKPIELFHGLKLYPEDETQSSTKKPVVVETYDELVFTEPLDTFFQRVRNNAAIHLYGSNAALAAAAAAPAEQEEKPTREKRGDTKNHPLAQWFNKYSDTEELARLSVARQQVGAKLSGTREHWSPVFSLFVEAVGERIPVCCPVKPRWACSVRTGPGYSWPACQAISSISRSKACGCQQREGGFCTGDVNITILDSL